MPRIFFQNGNWYCFDITAPSPRFVVHGATPKEAYEEWVYLAYCQACSL